MENSSPTNSGPDSEAASVDDLPADTKKNLEAGYIPEDISNKMAAATSYMGSFFNPSAWKNPTAEKSPEAPEGDVSPSKSSGSSGLVVPQIQFGLKEVRSGSHFMYLVNLMFFIDAKTKNARQSCLCKC